MTNKQPTDNQGAAFCRRTRREFMWEAGAGFTSVALAGLLSADGFLGRQAVAADGISPYRNPLAPKPSHFAAKAKSVIFLFMYATTASGLVIPDTAKEKPQEGTVVAVGPGRWDEDGDKRIPLDVSKGDVVIYSKYGGTEIKYNGEEYLILSARDVLAVVDK